jgi:predicted nucleotidyltransferase
LSIPEFEADGFLPLGIHECTPEEISDRFGKFQITDRRPKLNDGLVRYITELKEADVGKYLIVNGSFVTQKETPSDIDVLLILKDDVDLTGDIPPFRKNAFSTKYISKYHKLDFHFGFEDDASAINILNNFLEVKYHPGQKKGILKINL